MSEIAEARAVHEGNESPYLQGNFAPVRKETTATALEVTGTIPGHLDGRYLKIGPNPLGDPDPERYEWFLGAGMVHGLRIRDGHAEWYRNRWVRSGEVARALGERPRRGPQLGGFDFAANTNVIGLGDRTFAITEGGARPQELSQELETIGPSDFCGTLRGGYTAHPKRDPATGDLHAVSYSPFHGNRVQYTVTGVDGRVRRAVDIPMRTGTMMHDFSLTERHVIIYDLPVVLDLSMLARARAGRAAGALLTRVAAAHPLPGPLERAAMRASSRGRSPSRLPYRWDPAHRPRVGVMPRDGGPAHLRWYDVEPCYVYHPLNAYEDGERIVLEVARHEKVFVRGAADPIVAPPTLDRWTIDRAAGSVKEERLDDRGQEFPRVDERLVGRRHRYGYTVGGLTAESTAPQALIKHDLRRGTSETVAFGAGREPGEFVFVPSCGDAAEDDGVVMGFVYDAASDRSDLVLLDAASLETVATVHLPVRVPHGFHGNWVPAAG
ncbi:carotenoid oxygenase family protein [Spirillospora sp. CA-294931]|uniref:carotenoid oxygenase family protein n=1 Tax=Spirillospora sp. CA-294931 TaxID=3240042 RepID=UPI003D8F5712